MKFDKIDFVKDRVDGLKYLNITRERSEKTKESGEKY
jgi:hypothetical protein